MDKMLWGTFLLTMVVLLLNSGHGERKQNWISLKETRKQEALDILKTVYNVFNNDTYISSIRNVTLSTWFLLAIKGAVEFGQTTCSKAESDVEKCPLKTEFQPTEDSQGVTRYVISNPVQKTCSQLLSQVDSCPFNEQTDQQKRVFCDFVITNYTINSYKVVTKIKCIKN